MDKKELIRKSAIKVIARDGYHAAKIKVIADEAGIAAGTVYLYFKSKEEILDYIFCVEHKKRANFVNDLNKKNIPIDKIIDHFLDFHLDCFRNEPDVANVLYKEVVTVSLFKEQKAKFYMDEVFKAFVNILKREQDQGIIRKDLSLDFISASVINFLRVSSYSILSQGECANYEDMKKYLKSFILDGIK